MNVNFQTNLKAKLSKRLTGTTKIYITMNEQFNKRQPCFNFYPCMQKKFYILLNAYFYINNKGNASNNNFV